MAVIKERARQSKGNGSVPWSGVQIQYWNECLGQNGDVEPSAKHAIELFVSVPSLFQAPSSINTVSLFFL